MGYIGVSLIIGAVVYLLARPPKSWVEYLRSLWLAAPPLLPPPPPPPPKLKQPPAEHLEPAASAHQPTPEDDQASTPKASAVPAHSIAPVPSFSLTDSDHDPSPTPAPVVAAPAKTSSSPGLMAPPPPRRPGSMAPPPPRLPPLTQPAPSASSLSRSTLPIPNRGPRAASSSSLAPPPTHTSSTAPARSSRLVALAPGHSPMDWARISGPDADLRNLPARTPYLRVSPSMLRRRDGRKGRDAWSAYGGRVYNVTPYLKFHPGGEGELLRGAGKDATRLFAEVHPWVNYETMLAACLVGVAVPEGEGTEDAPQQQQDGRAERPSPMDEMD